MATQIGPKIGIEGENEYRQQLKQIINQTKTLDSEMKKVTSTWDKNTSELTKNAAMAKNTQVKLELLNEKQEILNKLLKEATDKFGESSAAAQSYQRALNSTETTINTLNQEMKSFGGAEGFSELSTSMADIGTKMQNWGQKLSSIGQSMTTSITLPLVAAGAAAVKFASDTEEAGSKVDVVFGSMAEQVRSFADNALNSYGLAEGTALQMTGAFGAMASAMGFSEQASADMAIELTKLSADLSSFHNVSTEVAQHSLQGIFTGETEALKKFVGTMSQANLEEFAAKQGKVYNAMSESEKVMTRYAYVMEHTMDAQGDFAMTFDGTANSFRTLQESLKQLASSFGEELLPIITPIVQKIALMAQAFSNLPAPIKKFIVVLGLIVAAVGPVLMVIGGLMSSLGAIITQGPIIATAFMSMIPAIQSLAAAFGELTLAAAPWLALAAAIAAAGYLVYSNWDSISESINNAADQISTAYNKVMSLNDSLKASVNGFISDIISDFAKLPRKIVESLREAVNAIKEEFKRMVQNAKKSGSDFVTGFIDGIKSKVQPLIDQVKKIAKTIEDYLGFSTPDKGPLHKYNTWMPDFLNGLAQGIKQNKSVVIDAVNGLAKSMTLPLDANASMNMALAGADGSSTSVFGGTTMNVYVDHISELNDLIRIQNQAQQRYRMGVK